MNNIEQAEDFSNEQNYQKYIHRFIEFFANIVDYCLNDFVELLK